MSIFRIESSVPFDSNIYLVVDKRTMLVDTGSGLDHDCVVAGIHSILGDRGLDMIILTHCHFDHTGGLAALIREFKCPAYAGGPDADCIRRGDSVHTLSDMFGYDFEPVDVRDLRDGDVIDLGTRNFRVIWTPGHTTGGICLYDGIAGTLISGDTLFEAGVGRTDFPGGDMIALRNSIRALSNIDIKELYPGHGSICINYDPAMLARVMTLVGV